MVIKGKTSDSKLAMSIVDSKAAICNLTGGPLFPAVSVRVEFFYAYLAALRDQCIRELEKKYNTLG